MTDYQEVISNTRDMALEEAATFLEDGDIVFSKEYIESYRLGDDMEGFVRKGYAEAIRGLKNS